jgi:hypothetical protein
MRNIAILTVACAVVLWAQDESSLTAPLSAHMPSADFARSRTIVVAPGESATFRDGGAVVNLNRTKPPRARIRDASTRISIDPTAPTVEMNLVPFYPLDSRECILV